MKTHSKIFIAFLLNLFFSAVEFIGGLLTGSFAILSDSLHDLADAGSIGISFLLEKKSNKSPDKSYTYGYKRYSVIGGAIMSLILIFGSIAIIYKSVLRILNPTPINHSGMIILAVLGITVNLLATLVTRDKHSINEKAVNLHMLEDVLSWIVVLIGAVVIKFTGLTIIDPLLSISVSIFVLINSTKNLSETISVFLEKTPTGLSVDDIYHCLCKIDGISDIHHIHLWSMDGSSNYATMHIVTDREHSEIKRLVKSTLRNHNITHITLELESSFEQCLEKHCKTETHNHLHAHHHH